MGKGKRNKATKHQRNRERLIARHNREHIDLETGTATPEDQAAAFFNRPGDYYEARFVISTGDGPTDGKFGATTVLKADESQFAYLLEVLRQIKGGFGQAMRVELTRTHTVAPEPAYPNPPTPAFEALTKAAQNTRLRRPRIGESIPGQAGYLPPAPRPDLPGPTIPDGPPYVMGRDFTLGPRYGSDDPDFREYAAGVRNGEIPPHLSGVPLGLEEDALTRDELAAGLPGQTRAEVAAELGRDPRDLGDEIKHVPSDVSAEKLAAELGIPVDSLQPLPMRGGGMAYAIKPEPAEPEGKHAAGDPPERPSLTKLFGDAWAGPGWYVIRPQVGQARNVNTAVPTDLLNAITDQDVEVYKARQIRDEPQA